MMLRSIVSEKSLKFKFLYTRKKTHPHTSAQNSTKTAANTHEATFIRTITSESRVDPADY